MDKSKYFAAAEKSLQKGQTDKAIEALETLLKSDPSDVKALTRLADLYLKEDNAEKAVEYLRRIGESYTKGGFYSKAVAIYKRILKVDRIPSRSILMDTHEKLAALYGQLSLMSDAMNHFAIVVEYYDQIGDQDSLLNVLKKVSNMDPSNTDNHMKLVDLFMAQNRMEEALESLSQMETYAKEKNSVSDLIRVYEKLIEHFPNDFDKLQSLVDLLTSSGEPKRALAKIQIAFKHDPKNSKVLELLAATFRAMRQPDKAKAVEVELLKVYRQAGQSEKIAEIEARHLESASSPAADIDQTKKASLSSIRENVDPIESLINALPLSADERKVMTECDVYFKYGLAEKAYEVLRSKLAQFPQSLVLRWKLKMSAQDLKRQDETAHILGEIIMLAKKQNLEIWTNLAISELKAIDPNHPVLSEQPAKKPDDGQAKAAKAVSKAAEQPSFSDSEVSVIIDDDLSGEFEDLSEISFQDLEISDVQKGDFDTKTLPGKSMPNLPKKVAEALPAKPEAVKEKAESLKAATSKVSKEVEDTIELFDDVDPLQTEIEPKVAAPANAHEVESSADDNEFEIISESDFSPEELKHLEGTLSGDTQTAKMPLAKEEITDAEEKIILEEDTYTINVEDALSPMEETLGAAAPEMKEEPAVQSSDSLKDGLEEISFYKSQGLEKEARQVADQLKKKFPSRPEIDAQFVDLNSEEPSESAPSAPIKKKVHEVEALGRKVKLHVQDDDRENEDFFDLASELDQELREEAETPPEIKDVFAAFKQGVAATVDKSDWQTHLDLGVAYREMGLLEDAIQEFKFVGQVEGQQAVSHYQIGLTQVAMEKWKEAQISFEKGLKSPSISEDERISLTYELAEVYYKQNNKDQARKLFAEILKRDPDYREVTERMKAIG